MLRQCNSPPQLFPPVAWTAGREALPARGAGFRAAPRRGGPGRDGLGCAGPRRAGPGWPRCAGPRQAGPYWATLRRARVRLGRTGPRCTAPRRAVLRRAGPRCPGPRCPGPRCARLGRAGPRRAVPRRRVGGRARGAARSRLRPRLGVPAGAHGRYPARITTMSTSREGWARLGLEPGLARGSGPGLRSVAVGGDWLAEVGQGCGVWLWVGTGSRKWTGDRGVRSRAGLLRTGKRILVGESAQQ
jgi:hypothetical protein